MTKPNATIGDKVEQLRSSVEALGGHDLSLEEVLAEIEGAERLATEIGTAITVLGHMALVEAGVITVGLRTHPGDSCFNTRYEKLAADDTQGGGTTLKPGDQMWGMEGKFILPILPLAYPVRIENEDGDLVRSPFGIKRRK